MDQAGENAVAPGAAPAPAFIDYCQYQVTPEYTNIGNNVMVKKTQLAKVKARRCGMSMIRFLAHAIWTNEQLGCGSIKDLPEDKVEAALGKHNVFFTDNTISGLA